MPASAIATMLVISAGPGSLPDWEEPDRQFALQGFILARIS
jgi:hypothetical protein